MRSVPSQVLAVSQPIGLRSPSLSKKTWPVAVPAFVLLGSLAFFVAAPLLAPSDAWAGSEPTPIATQPVLEAQTPIPASEEPTALSKLSAEVMNVLVPSFVMLIGLLVAWTLNKVRKKFHLDVSDAQIATWSVLAEKAAARAGEWVRHKTKNATDGKKIPGPEILEVAVNWAVEMGKAFNLPELGREKLEGLIESYLFKSRGQTSTSETGS